jgi:hypothetical protein
MVLLADLNNVSIPTAAPWKSHSENRCCADVFLPYVVGEFQIRREGWDETIFDIE